MSLGYEQAERRTVTSAAEPDLAAAEATPRAQKRSGLLGNLLKLALTVLITGYVLWQANVQDALDSLRTANWAWVALAAVSAVVSMVINVKRWQVMLEHQQGGAPLRTLVRFYLIGMFFNNVLPSRFAGDVVRAYGASISLTTRTRSAAAVVMDRLIGAISVLLLGVIAIVANPSVVQFELRLVIIVGLAMGVVAVSLLLLRTPFHGSARRLLGQFERLPLIGKRLGKRVSAAAEAVRAYSHAPGLIVRALIISMIANGLSILNIYLYALAVGADVQLSEAAVVAPVVLAVGVLPISINGLGTVELTYVKLFGLMGVEPGVALAVAILRRLVLLGLSLVGGVLYAVRRFG